MGTIRLSAKLVKSEHRCPTITNEVLVVKEVVVRRWPSHSNRTVHTSNSLLTLVFTLHFCIPLFYYDSLCILYTEKVHIKRCLNVQKFTDNSHYDVWVGKNEMICCCFLFPFLRRISIKIAKKPYKYVISEYRICTIETEMLVVLGMSDGCLEFNS